MADFDIGRLDEVIHGRVRLGVIAYLMVENPADFMTLKSKLGVNEGTLSVHLRKLEEAGHVRIEKTYKGRRPLTRVHLTSGGRDGFRKYLKALSGIIEPRTPPSNR